MCIGIITIWGVRPKPRNSRYSFGFFLIPGIYLVIVYNVNLYNNAIVYPYNNNLASSKPPYGRGEFLGTAHMCTK